MRIVEPPEIGSHLVDGDGRTLYLFADDAPGESRCRDAGDLKGQGRQDAWFAVSPAGERALASVPDPAPVELSVEVGWLPAPDLVYAAGSLWVPVGGDARVVRLDPGSGRVLATIPVGDADATKTSLNARSLVSDGEAVWVLHDTYASEDAELLRISPESNTVTDTIALAFPASDSHADRSADIVLGDGELWFVSKTHEILFRIDPAARAVVGRLELPTPTAVAYGHGSVWVATFGSEGATVQRLDPQTLEVTGRVPLEIPLQVLRMEIGPDAVWLTAGHTAGSGEGGVALRIDPERDEVLARHAVPSWPTGLVLAPGGAVWITALGRSDRGGDGADGRLIRIDSNRPGDVREWQLGRDPVGLVAAGERFWAAETAELAGTAFRIGLEP